MASATSDSYVSSAAPAYAGMVALGLLDAAPMASFRLQGNGAGKRVVILGAGLAGMCAAYELRKLGYDAVILEARARSPAHWTTRTISTRCSAPDSATTSTRTTPTPSR